MDKIDFNGRVAIVTGAGNGLGRDYALSLAARGARVVVNNRAGVDAKELRSADLVVEQIRAAGGTAVANYDTVGTRAAAEAMITTAMEHFGRIDVVINNAGNQANNRFEEMTEDEFNDVINVHLTGAFHLSQLAYRIMMKQGYGRFLFTSSASALFGLYLRANYSAAKAGLIGLMHSVALEGERYGILANALLPLATGTSGRLGKAPPQALWPDWQARLPTTHPAEMALLAPSMTPAKVTALVLYLTSERCRTTHAMYSSAGGRYSRVFLGVTPGWLSAQQDSTTPEDIDTHFADIESRENFEEFSFITDELLSIARQLKRVSDHQPEQTSRT